MDFNTVLADVEASAPLVAKAGEVLLDIAKVMPGTSSAIGAFTLAVQIANGLINAVPAIQQTYTDIQTAVAGGTPVSADQWAAWQTSVDSTHSDFVAAAQKVADGQ